MNPSTTHYYKPTTLLQKIKKVLRLYYLSFITRGSRIQLNERALSILMFVPEVDRTGGYEKQALQLATALAEEQNVVCVFGSSAFNGAPAKELRGGFELRRINTQGKISLFWSVFAVSCFLVRRSHAYQVVHLHGVTGFTLFTAKVARLLRLPVIIKPATHGDVREIKAISAVRRRLYHSWVRSADRFVAVSEQISDELHEANINAQRIVRIPNFVDPDRFHPASADKKQFLRKTHDVPLDSRVFLYLGRLERRKGVEYLLRAWKTISNGVLWIVGNGPEQGLLENTAREMNLARITFFGPTETPLNYYQAADVFVFPSLREGSPNALLEAMSCGLACIATRIGGVTDIIDDDKEGLLIEPQSPEALEYAMNRLSTDAAKVLALSAAARAKVENHFRIDQVTQKYIQLYTELRK